MELPKVDFALFGMPCEARRRWNVRIVNLLGSGESIIDDAGWGGFDIFEPEAALSVLTSRQPRSRGQGLPGPCPVGWGM